MILSKEAKVRHQILLTLTDHGHFTFELEYLPFASENAENCNKGSSLTNPAISKLGIAWAHYKSRSEW